MVTDNGTGILQIMSVDNWINLGVAIGTFLLALAAVWAIYQNYRIRKEDKDFRIKTAAIDDIHQWLMDILHTTTIYLSAIRDGNEKQAYLALSHCRDVVSIRGMSMIVAALIFESDLMEKVKQVIEVTEKYLDDVENVKPGQPIQGEIVEKLAKAIVDAFGTLEKYKMGILPEYFMKNIKQDEDKETKEKENMSKEDETTGNNEPTIKNIEKHLIKIEGMVQSINERQLKTAWQWLYNLGISTMAVGATWVIARTHVIPDLQISLIMFFIGLLIVLVAFFSRFQKKQM